MRKTTYIAKIFIACCLSIAVSCTSNKTSENKNIQENKSDTSAVSETESPDSELEVLDGWLKYDTDQQIIIDKLGLPEKKDKEEYWGATGNYVQTWYYSILGIELDMESDEKGDLKKTRNITIKSPCKFKTSKGIGIGSDSKLIKETYSKLIDTTQSDSNYIVVGTIYWGTIFNLKNNIVESIFIGAAAD